MTTRNKYVNLLLTSVVALFIGAVIMLVLGHNPIEAYIQLFRGAFVGKLNLGTTLQKFLPLLLTAMAFAVAARAGVFNVGVEGSMYLGAISAAWVGFTFSSLPGVVIIVFAILIASIVGALWSAIPGSLRAGLEVNEVCSTILLNYVAIHITSYLVNGPLSGKTGVPQTPPIAEGAKFNAVFAAKPGSYRTFIGIVVVILLI